jgi:hypothetical protein
MSFLWGFVTALALVFLVGWISLALMSRSL